MSVLGAYKPCPREACHFSLVLFCSLLKVSRVHIAPKCNTALPWVCSNTPATREVDWMNDSRHNKNANRHTDPAFIREKNTFSPLPPKLRLFCADYYRSFEAQKMVFGPALVKTIICYKGIYQIRKLYLALCKTRISYVNGTIQHQTGRLLNK